MHVFPAQLLENFDMQNDLDTRSSLDDRRSGIGGGTIAMIVAAVVIVGALFMWNSGSHTGTASNDTTGTTTGSASTTRPAAPVTAPAPATTR
jgi:hypothetical protein